MAHDNAVFKNTSWGRTRGPKNIAGPHGTEISTSVAAEVDAAPSTVSQGYATENQRYLHIRFYRSQASLRKINVWAWSHAFGAWAPLTDVSGTAVAISVNNTTKYQVFEISGVDRVFFKVDSGSLHSDDTFHAACSTF